MGEGLSRCVWGGGGMLTRRTHRPHPRPRCPLGGHVEHMPAGSGALAAGRHVPVAPALAQASGPSLAAGLCLRACARDGLKGQLGNWLLGGITEWERRCGRHLEAERRVWGTRDLIAGRVGGASWPEVCATRRRACSEGLAERLSGPGPAGTPPGCPPVGVTVLRSPRSACRGHCLGRQGCLLHPLSPL